MGPKWIFCRTDDFLRLLCCIWWLKFVVIQNGSERTCSKIVLFSTCYDKWVTPFTIIQTHDSVLATRLKWKKLDFTNSKSWSVKTRKYGQLSKFYLCAENAPTTFKNALNSKQNPRKPTRQNRVFSSLGKGLNDLQNKIRLVNNFTIPVMFTLIEKRNKLLTKPTEQQPRILVTSFTFTFILSREK